MTSLQQVSIISTEFSTPAKTRTGLDAHSAFQIVQTLKDLARAGRTVIISIHTPRSEIWDLFDQVILLSKGATLYCGPSNTAVSHFEKLGHDLPPFVNPAEFLVDLAAVDGRTEAVESASLGRIQMLKEAWKSRSASDSSCEPKMLPSPHASDGSQIQGVGFSRQLAVMTKRSMKTTLRDPLGMAGGILQAIVMAVVYGWIFFKLGRDQAGIRSREGALYITVYQSYLVLMFEVYRLTVDIRLFDMERLDGVVGVPAFLLSRRLAKVLLEDLPIPTVFSLIYYFMVGFRKDVASFLVFLAVDIALNFSAVTLACLCVSISRNFAVASMIANLAFTIQFLSCGWVVQIDQIPAYLRWVRWTVSGNCSSMVSHN